MSELTDGLKLSSGSNLKNTRTCLSCIHRHMHRNARFKHIISYYCDRQEMGCRVIDPHMAKCEFYENRNK